MTKHPFPRDISASSAPTTVALLYAQKGEKFVPVQADALGGGGSTAPGEPAPGSTVQDPSGAALSIGAGQVQLSPPSSATHARLEVTSGAVRWALGGDAGPQTARLDVGDALSLSGAELAALRLTRDGGSDVAAYVTYWRVG